MLCSKPFRKDGMEFACGLCLPCRINRRREWTCRAVLESLTHSNNSVLTLTYNEENYPTDGSVSVQACQTFLRAYRSKFGPVRYMMVGEYGGRTSRAHYHALLFGASPSLSDVESTWKLGFCKVDVFSLQSAAYVCGYVVKKLIGSVNTGPSLRPEFLRCSLRPGIGARALDTLEALHYQDYGARFIAEHRDVMRMVRFGGRLYPIGRYLTMKLRERMGLPSSDPLRLEVIRSEMQAVSSHPDLLNQLESRREASRRNAKTFAMRMRTKETL